MSKIEIYSRIRCHGGELVKFHHRSETVSTEMVVNVFLPENYTPNGEFPCLLYLSGLTCTPQNASEKAGMFQYASEHGFVVVLPDTSPRGAKVPGEDDDWDFGSGAGFYLNATKQPWAEKYRMYDYILKELLGLISSEFPGGNLAKLGVLGHSMGGFGAIMMYLKNPTVFTSCSAFSPICNPSNVPWGEKAFSGYLSSESEWKEYDPCCLIKGVDQKRNPIKIHVGSADQFLYQLTPGALVDAAVGTAMEGGVVVNEVEGYDHSYYFVQSFIGEHMAFHSQYLK